MCIRDSPKGVLYSHRSTMLHTYASLMPDAISISSRDCVMPVVPMFHANAWGLPYSCAMVGAKLVLPGAALDGKSLHELITSEHVSFAAGVPTMAVGLITEPAQAEQIVASGQADSTQALDGPTLSIRRFGADPLKIEDLLRFGTILPLSLIHISEPTRPY